MSFDVSNIARKAFEDSLKFQQTLHSSPVAAAATLANAGIQNGILADQSLSQTLGIPSLLQSGTFGQDFRGFGVNGLGGSPAVGQPGINPNLIGQLSNGQNLDTSSLLGFIGNNGIQGQGFVRPLDAIVNKPQALPVVPQPATLPVVAPPAQVAPTPAAPAVIQQEAPLSPEDIDPNRVSPGRQTLTQGMTPASPAPTQPDPELVALSKQTLRRGMDPEQLKRIVAARETLAQTPTPPAAPSTTPTAPTALNATATPATPTTGVTAGGANAGSDVVRNLRRTLEKAFQADPEKNGKITIQQVKDAVGDVRGLRGGDEDAVIKLMESATINGTRSWNMDGDPGSLTVAEANALMVGLGNKAMEGVADPGPGAAQPGVPAAPPAVAAAGTVPAPVAATPLAQPGILSPANSGGILSGFGPEATATVPLAPQKPRTIAQPAGDGLLSGFGPTGIAGATAADPSLQRVGNVLFRDNGANSVIKTGIPAIDNAQGSSVNINSLDFLNTVTRFSGQKNPLSVLQSDPGLQDLLGSVQGELGKGTLAFAPPPRQPRR